MVALYNEIDDYAADWLENLISAGLIAPGVVDRRSIVDLQPADLAGFTQVHFFAGIGGWSLAARLAGWPDDRPLWTGSCPCQPFSVAGKQAGQADVRHLWPEFHRLIAGCRPPVVMGEQVAAAVGKSWLDGVCSDLESIGYTCGAAVVPACAVDAPHRRDRLWFVADTALMRSGSSEDHAGSIRETLDVFSKPRDGSSTTLGTGSYWSVRQRPPLTMAHGVPARVGKLRALGNAIVPQVAAEIIGAYMDCTSKLC